MQQMWMNVVRMAALAGACLAACIGQAQVQGSLRDSVAGPLHNAQEAIKANHPDDALALAAPVRAMADLNGAEKDALERVSAVASMNAKHWDQAIAAYEYLAQEPAAADANRKVFLEPLVSASISAKDFARVARWSQECLKAGCDTNRYRLSLLQALFHLGRYSDVVQAMAPERLAGTPAAREVEWRVVAASQLQLKDTVGYCSTLQELIRVAPDNKAYWADLLSRQANLPGYSARNELDVWRLMQETGNLEEPQDYSAMADLALKAGLPAEASRVMDQGVASKALNAGATEAQRKNIRSRMAQDDQDMPALVAGAKDATALAQLAEVYASKLQWADATAAFDKALKDPNLRRVDEVRLHAAIAHYRAGDVRAEDYFNLVGGEQKALATLWLLRLKTVHS